MYNSGNPLYFVSNFTKIVACKTAEIMKIYQYSIRIHFSVYLNLFFWLELNLIMSFRNEDMHLQKQKNWPQKSRKLVFSSFSYLFVKPNRHIIVWMQLVILWMSAAEGTFGFDRELKKRSSLATVLDKNSYIFNWISVTFMSYDIRCYITQLKQPSLLPASINQICYMTAI